jgi:hypothetical protein
MAESDDFLYELGPVGLAPPVRCPVIDGDLRVFFALRFCPPARAA